MPLPKTTANTSTTTIDIQDCYISINHCGRCQRQQCSKDSHRSDERCICRGDGSASIRFEDEEEDRNDKRQRDTSAENSPTSQQNAKVARTASKPILIFKPSLISNLSTFEARSAVSEVLREAGFDSNNIKFSITQNDNVLVHIESTTMRQQLLGDSIFSDCKKIDLSKKDSKPALIMRGLTFDEAIHHYHKGNFESIGVVEVVEMSTGRHDGRTPRLVRVVFESQESIDRALGVSFIRLDFFPYYFEKPGSNPTQCRSKCKGFGHIEAKCKDESVCGNCGGKMIKTQKVFV